MDGVAAAGLSFPPRAISTGSCSSSMRQKRSQFSAEADAPVLMTMLWGLLTCSVPQ